MDRWQQVVQSGLCRWHIALIETSQTGMQQLGVTREIERTSGSVGLRMNAKNARLWSAMLGRTIQQ